MRVPRSARSTPFRWLILAGAACLLLASPVTARAQTGTVSGTVTNDATGAPVAGLTVGVVTLDGSFVAASITDGSGGYSITVPIGALYYVVTGTTGGFLPEAFPDVQCITGFCGQTDLREAEPFSITSG